MTVTKKVFRSGDGRRLRPLRSDPSLMVFASATVELHDDALPWVVVLDVVNESGLPECTRFEMVSQPDGPPIAAEDLRKVPLGRLVREALSFMALQVEGQGAVGPAEGDEGRFHAAVDRERSVARRRITDDELREVARVYEMAVAAGVPTGRAVQDALNLDTGDKARQRIKKAKDAGFLERA